MRLAALSLACLLLAACAPVVYVTPAGSDGVVLPEQAQRVLDSYTATARVMATQSALATAAGVSARETATGAALGTLGALAAAQTQAGLELTQGAALAAATDASAARTQAAGQTQAAATPTAAAMARAVQSTAAAEARHSTQADIDLQGRRLLWSMVLVVGTLLALVLAGIVVWFFYERQKIAKDVFHNVQWARVDQAQAETQRAQAEAVRACLVERDGRPYLITPSGLVPMLPAALEPVPQANRAGEWRWRAALKRAVSCGIELGRSRGRPQFGERDLAGAEPGQAWVVNPDGTPSSAGYRKINKVLRRAGVWTTSGRDTSWGPDWDEERFKRDFDATPLLELPAGEPPEVRIPHRSSAVSAIHRNSAVPQ